LEDVIKFGNDTLASDGLIMIDLYVTALELFCVSGGMHECLASCLSDETL